MRPHHGREETQSGCWKVRNQTSTEGAINGPPKERKYSDADRTSESYEENQKERTTDAQTFITKKGT